MPYTKSCWKYLPRPSIDARAFTMHGFECQKRDSGTSSTCAPTRENVVVQH